MYLLIKQLSTLVKNFVFKEGVDNSKILFIHDEKTLSLRNSNMRKKSEDHC